MNITGTFGPVSGQAHHACHFIAYRFDADVGLHPDCVESWVVSRDGDRMDALYGRRGWFTGVWRGPGGVFVTDVAGRVYRNPDPRPRAARWEHYDVPGRPEGIFGIDTEHVYVWGRRGGRPMMCRWNGTRWEDMPSPGRVVAMHGSAPDALVAVGEAGLVARWDGARWHSVDAGTGVTLSGVHRAPSGEIMVCGKGTVLLRGSDGGWEQVLTSPDLTGSVAHWGDAWWVGAGGALGLCRLEDDQLVSVKPNLPATSFDAPVPEIGSASGRISLT